MPRPLRTLYPGVPIHVVQCGHNRGSCFLADEDYFCYLTLLGEVLQRSGIALHAYVLMTNHVHLLMTPTVEEDFTHAMISVGSRYVRYVNRKYGRVGTLWDGRFRSSLVQSEQYLFLCQRYIELNPVRAGMVRQPADYRWSSYRSHAFGTRNELVTYSQSYLALADTPQIRQNSYRRACEVDFETDMLARIRWTIEHNRPLGDDAFIRSIEESTDTKPPGRPVGRPRIVRS